MSRGQQLDLDLVVQPALEVTFYMLEGDMIFLGTTAAIQMEIRDLNGEPYDPSGSIFVEVYRVASAAPETDPVAQGVATQMELEGVPVPGHYVFEFDTTLLEATSPGVDPTQGLARATIPYNNSSVVWQKTFQLKSLNDLS